MTTHYTNTKCELPLKSKHSKPRILIFGEDVALSHVVRPMVLANAIKEDYEVIFATGDRYAHLIKEQELPCLKIWTLPAEVFLDRLAKGQDALTTDEFSRQAREELELIKEVSPDLIIGDLRSSLGISSEVAKVPYIALINAHWSPYCTLMPPPPEMPFVKILGVKLSTILLPRLLPLILKKLVKPFDRARREYGLSPVGDYREIFVCATWVYYLDIPSLAPTQDMPTNHTYIGPVMWSPKITFPDWWEKVPQNKPVAYVAMGSTGKITFIDELIDELTQMGLTIMLSTSGRFDPKDYPDNVFAADYLPGNEACERSTFIICNGGTGAIYQAIQSSTPILGIPTNGDQYFAMGSVQEQGAGLLIRSTHVSRRYIRDTASKLMSDQSYQHRCKELSRELANYDSVERFKDLIKSLW